LYEGKDAREKREIIALKNDYTRATDDRAFIEDYVDNASSMEQIRKFVKDAVDAAALRNQAAVNRPPPSPPSLSRAAVAQPPQLTAEEQETKSRERAEKKKQKASEREAKTVDLSKPLAPSVKWGFLDTAKIASTPAPHNSSPSAKQPSKVERLIERVEKWNRISDGGKKVALEPAQAIELLNGLEGILTQSEKNSAFYVGFSEGETKYDGNVCIKAIAGYSKGVTQATAHQPTYHFQVTNLYTLQDPRILE
jgi:hypothetical protein